MAAAIERLDELKFDGEVYILDDDAMDVFRSVLFDVQPNDFWYNGEKYNWVILDEKLKDLVEGKIAMKMNKTNNEVIPSEEIIKTTIHGNYFIDDHIFRKYGKGTATPSVERELKNIPRYSKVICSDIEDILDTAQIIETNSNGTCLIHSILMCISPTYRTFNRTEQGYIGDFLRYGYILDKASGEQKLSGTADKQKENVDYLSANALMTDENGVEVPNPKFYLTETQILFLVNVFSVNIVVCEAINGMIVIDGDVVFIEEIERLTLFPHAKGDTFPYIMILNHLKHYSAIKFGDRYILSNREGLKIENCISTVNR